MTAPPVETQPERTALAWQRTGLGVLGVAGLLGHRALHLGRPLALVAAGVVALLGLAVLGALAPARYLRLRARPGGRDAAAPGHVAAVTGVVTLTALATLVTVLFPR